MPLFGAAYAAPNKGPQVYTDYGLQRMLNPPANDKIQGLFKAFECFLSTFKAIYFPRTFQDSPVYSSTFQACTNPGYDTFQ